MPNHMEDHPNRNPVSSASKDPNFSHTTLDDRQQQAPLELVGKKFRHSGNRHIYVVIDVTWMGDMDEWGLIYTREGSAVKCTRSATNFFGMRTTAEPRFLKP